MAMVDAALKRLREQEAWVKAPEAEVERLRQAVKRAAEVLNGGGGG
jgi:hypothetical protein